MSKRKTIKIEQGNKGGWYVLSDDREQIEHKFSTARAAAAHLIYEHLDTTRPLVLEFQPYTEQEPTQ